ncbi:hypothetical protein SANA_15750 [Gottschalkiaceae bacterium SANA]|nr:hypothetical protein SANA_15750 [Gottschalkiaceae bacterium SANA]
MNEIHTMPTTWRQVNSMVEDLIKTLNGPTDSFWEEKLIHANVYQISKNNQAIGFFSVFQKETITSFYLIPEAWSDAQEIFQLAIKHEFVQEALVATCDEAFLSHSLDVGKKVERQAYFFETLRINESKGPFSLEVAMESDQSFIQEKSGEFFDDLEQQICRQEIYLGKVGDEIVGFGVMELGVIRKEMASIGMYVCEEYRRKGFGTRIIQELQRRTIDKNRIPIAGCWVWNHGSKKTLERAGLISQTRYMKISF